MFIMMISSYMCIVFSPTYISSLVIMIKEITMNQSAWTKEQDTEDVFIEIDNSFFKLFGVPESDEYYSKYIKNFSHEFL